jgi:hypothetical protein
MKVEFWSAQCINQSNDLYISKLKYNISGNEQWSKYKEEVPLKLYYYLLYIAYYLPACNCLIVSVGSIMISTISVIPSKEVGIYLSVKYEKWSHEEKWVFVFGCYLVVILRIWCSFCPFWVCGEVSLEWVMCNGLCLLNMGP